MSDRSRIKDVEGVEPPELWTEILAREPASFPLTQPRLSNRARVATALVIVVAVAGVLVPLRFLGSGKGGRSINVPPGHDTITITEPSESMLPTIAVGQAVVVDVDAYVSAQPARGDVVAFGVLRQGPAPNQSSGFTFIKRVIGLPGDTVEQRADGTVYVNGEELVEPYVGDVDAKALGPWTVEAGHVFVMGDNRANSNDSRYGIGQVPIKDIEGKVLLEVEPTGTPSSPPPAAVAEAGGRLSATYLPPGFKLRSTTETPASAIPGDQTYSQSFGRYNSDRSGFEAELGITMMKWSPSLDVDGEVVRYPGARQLTVRGHDALYLPERVEREGSTLAWMERDGLLIQVVASGISQEALVTVAEGLRVGNQDPGSGGTFEVGYPPAGFEPLQGGRPDFVAGPVPRVFFQQFAPRGQEANPFVTISQGYASLTSPDLRPVVEDLVIRGRSAILYEGTEPSELAIAWAEADGLNVLVIGRGVSREDLIAVANGLQPGAS